ncbi:MAG: molybdopterin-dependent oxidoreductase [Verrucomicrobia bacterium]|nr:MAG: molybdopterin-dependent oxidoreductase [Verrucomicrobiota bacterium]
MPCSAEPCASHTITIISPEHLPENFMILSESVSRRSLLKSGGILTALGMLHVPFSAYAKKIGNHGTLLPFLDVQPAGKMLKWENMTQWLTPKDQVFSVSHYGQPKIDENTWQLHLNGLVKHPLSLTIDQIKARRKKHVFATLECSGNGANPGFMGAIGNIRWTGTPLRALLSEAGIKTRASEVVFFGADEKIEKIREKDYLQNFARSLSLTDTLSDDVLLAYEMNGEPLGPEHGAPLRLVVPGWFGIAWVKWLTRIEVTDRRFMSKYMGREYVTIRGEERDGKTIWRETSVGPKDVKSIVARALKMSDGTLRFFGAAWTDGTPLAGVEIQIRTSDKETPSDRWLKTELDRTQQSKYSWTFFSFDWKKPQPGDWYIVSRATDTEGRVQPAFDDEAIKLKRTYWEANQQWPRKLKV